MLASKYRDLSTTSKGASRMIWHMFLVAIGKRLWGRVIVSPAPTLVALLFDLCSSLLLFFFRASELEEIRVGSL
jgi:hypothetical protein